MRKKSAGWIKFTKHIYRLITYGVQCINTKQQPLSKVSACCRCSLPSCLLVGTGLLVRCKCNNRYYYTGLLQVQTTAQMAGYFYAGPLQVYQKCMLVGTSLHI